MRWALEATIFVATVLFVVPASAVDARGETNAEPSYGRIEGDVTLAAAAGLVLGPSAPRGAGELRVRYLDTAGLFVAYEDEALVGSSSRPERALSTGLELRPLFLFRWLQGYELYRPRLDLAIDSFGIEVGAVFAQAPGSAFGADRALQTGVGIELPIQPRATGPWIGLHAGLRWSELALASGTVRGIEDRAGYLSVTFGWHQVLSAHLVDVGDEPPH